MGEAEQKTRSLTSTNGNIIEYHVLKGLIARKEIALLKALVQITTIKTTSHFCHASSTHPFNLVNQMPIISYFEKFHSAGLEDL